MNATSTDTTAKTRTSTRENVTPRLTCIITGKSRLTNRAYLESKAGKASSVENYLKHYISREALKHLRAGKTVEETRQILGVTDYNAPISAEFLKKALSFNGKWGSKSE
jgi:hypothetical protein